AAIRKRLFRNAKSTPISVCSVVSHFKSPGSRVLGASILYKASANTVFPADNWLRVAYAPIAWDPVFPQLARILRSEIKELSRRNASSLSFQANAAEGKKPHLFPSLYLDEPSERKLTVANIRLSNA